MKAEGGAIYPREYLAMGDFNIEPFDEVFEMKLYAFRDRDRAKQRPHYSDGDVSRIRLYNCGWRHLGETHPHTPDHALIGHSGTYYQSSKRVWRTFDQLLVTGGLLTEKKPALDESQLLVRSDASSLGEGGKPNKFAFVDDVGAGLSDHLPISGKLLLS